MRVLLFGAPLALALSFLLHETPGHHAAFRIDIDRRQAIAAAHKTAARLGLDTRGWAAQVRTQVNSDMVEYFRRRPVSQAIPARRFAGEIGAAVMLTSPGGGTYLNLTFAADGTELGYRIAGTDLKPAPPLAEDEMLALAAIEMRSVFKDFDPENLGTPEVSVNESAGVEGVRRVTFRPFAPNAPEVDFTVNFDFLGNRIIAREVQAEAAEPFTMRFLRQSRALSTYGNTYKLSLALIFSLYAAYRFSRRIADREAPVMRAIVLTAVIPVCGTFIYFLEPALAFPELKPEHFTAAGMAIGLLSRLPGFFIQGIVMGMGYGGGEGSIREKFPGKLASLDAILRGRIFSANAGQAVITGAAIGCWLVLLNHLLLPITGNPVTTSILINTSIALSSFPWLVYFLQAALIALFSGSVCLLVPLLVYRRWAARPAVLFLVLLLTAFSMGAWGEPHTPDSLDFWLRALLAALSLVAAFFIWDYLASLVAFTTVALLAPLADMLDRMPAWREVLPVAGVLAAATLVPMLVAAIRGRLYTEKELLPRYARVQAERLALQAELTAAREAQLRLLPSSLPAVPGLSLAASCTPAREVGGDFYDFIELEDGCLCVIVAEGGNDGLASALTIALAKGYLLFEAEGCRDVHQVLAGLERALGENLQRPGARTAIALLLVNPVDLSAAIARSGDFPRILMLSSNGAVREASLLEDTSDGIARGSLRLEADDSILVYTDGLARLAEQRRQGGVDEILRRSAGFAALSGAAAIHESVLGAILARERWAQADLTDDITAVVVSFTGDAMASRQEVA